eukprot:403331255
MNIKILETIYKEDSNTLLTLYQSQQVSPNGSINDFQMTALHLICSLSYEITGDNLIQVCLESGADPNIQDIYGRSPLHLAAASGNFQAIQQLMKLSPIKLNLDLQTIGGETPAYKAAQFCKSECLQLLLNQGCNPQLQTFEGENVYSFVEKSGNQHLIEVVRRWIENNKQNPIS